jgi:L-arabinose isomerase
MQQNVIGLLPLYLALYDNIGHDARPKVEAFYRTIASEFEKRGLKVITTPICRLKPEFEDAIGKFEDSGAEAIVTLHLAYSPSLESADALAATKLPIIVCDTTPVYDFGPSQDPDQIMFNHGIHGVQDMCNLLVRNGKTFQIEVGHWEKSDVLDRVTALVRAAGMAAFMRRIRAGLMGEPFKGMGDFFVPAAKLKSTLGIETVQLKPKAFVKLVESIGTPEIEAERAKDKERFEWGELSEEAYTRSIRIGLAIKKWIDAEQISAFSFNFLDINREAGIDTPPFLQASKLMSEGIGFGGEGDLLTASLVSTLSYANPDTSFSEMFCPDWKNNSIFLSHMGEFNYTLADGKAKLLEMDYSFSDADNPVYAVGRFKAGEFLLVDLLPLGDSYRLIIAPAAMLDIKGKNNIADKVHGWFRPRLPIEEFLKIYSEYGGTHHLAVAYDAPVRTLEAFGRMMGWDTVVIE